MKHNEFLQVLKYLKGYIIRYLASLILGQLMTSICYNLVLAYILKQVMNGITTANIRLLQSAFAIAGISFLTAFIFQPILKKWNQEVVKKVMNQLRSRVFYHMERLKVQEAEGHSTGDLITRITNDVDTLEEIYRTYLPSFTFALIHGILAICCMFTENVYMALMGVVLGVASIWLNNKISKKMEPEAKKYQENMGRFSEQVMEGSEGIEDLRANSGTTYFLNKIWETIHGMRKHADRRDHVRAASQTAGELAANLQQVGMLAVGFYLALSGKISIGSSMAVIQLNGNANYLFQNFSSFLTGIRKNLPSGIRVREFLELEEEPADIPAETEVQQEKNVWKMSNVSFGYTKDHPVLEHKNLEVHTGEFVGIVGKSGCGKSTFLKILLGFYQPDEGEVSFNGRSISRMARSEWRKQIAYVSQDCYLYQMSVYDNIRMGNRNADRKQVEQASRLAMADEFISRMEQGYDTMISENGSNLSGGQKQRIVLARAFLRDAGLFLIDEGTAALDAKTEMGIAETIEKIRGKKAVIMVSHRKEALKNADRIFEL